MPQSKAELLCNTHGIKKEQHFELARRYDKFSYKVNSSNVEDTPIYLNTDSNVKK